MFVSRGPSVGGTGWQKEGPFGPMCEAPHTYITGTDQLCGHMQPEIAEG